MSNLVLLVEDDDIVAGLMTHILSRAKLRVGRARNGAECRQRFEEHRGTIALIILDCRLPDTDGTALCRELRESAADVPMLLTSGRDESHAAVIEDGTATAFLAKPFRPLDVQHKIAALLA